MGNFANNIRPYVNAELEAADRDPARAFAHLERAHVRVHWRMFQWALRNHDAREAAGQIPRLIGAATKTFIGLVPSGNTGGSNVSAIQPMPVDPELAAIIERARGRG